jgi:uncharacterized protein (DUF433 family)
MTSTEIYPHITRNQRGEPTITDIRTRVQSVVCYYKLGMSAEEIHAALPYLSDAELHAAFAYYFDNTARSKTSSAKKSKSTHEMPLAVLKKAQYSKHSSFS